MKPSRVLLLVGVVLVLAASAVVVRGLLGRESVPADGVLAVDQLAKNPTAYADRVVTLDGVVSAQVPEQQLFTLIDLAEYADCKVVSCSQYQVPVAFAGDLPGVEQSVRVTGRLVQPEPGRFLVQASAVEPVP